MKIAVINFSGNVGKTTVARHLLSPRMNNAEVISVESINSDGTEDEAIRGKQFGDLLNALDLIDDAVIDIGASNVEDFLVRMKQYRGSHEDIDYFVIPTVPARKQQRDTIGTISELADMGIPAEKILLVMNQVEPEDVAEDVFEGIFSFHKTHQNFMLRPDAVIRVNDLYAKLKGNERTISAIIKDTDIPALKRKLIETTGNNERLAISREISLKRLCEGVQADLDTVFQELIGD